MSEASLRFRSLWNGEFLGIAMPLTLASLISVLFETFGVGDNEALLFCCLRLMSEFLRTTFAMGLDGGPVYRAVAMICLSFLELSSSSFVSLNMFCGTFDNPSLSWSIFSNCALQ